MTEPNLYDLVVDELLNMQNLVRAELRQQFGKVKPFRMTPMSSKEALYNYETQGYDIFKQIADTDGIESAVEWQTKMQQEKARMVK